VETIEELMSSEEHHDDFGGLQRDLRSTRFALTRREALRMTALGLAFGTIPWIGCSTTAGADLSNDETAGNPNCSKTPSETAGPFPGEGSNGPNVLNQSGVVRSDIRSSFAGLSGTADGVPLTIVLNLVAISTCAPLANRAVYIWHCDRLGRYSLYSSGVTDQNYLRGVQEADANGKVTFTSIYPGCYSGRWPHIHFEVFPTLASANNVNHKIATSQIALPKSANDAVYAKSQYTGSAGNQSQVTLASDMVFSDGASLELATMTGSVDSGLTATLTVAI
jgi:protocatechuate 3,4-dioxygenase beta subunit